MYHTMMRIVARCIRGNGVLILAKAKYTLNFDFAAKIGDNPRYTEGLIKAAMFEGAKIAADELKISLKGVLSQNATGELLSTMGVSKIKKNGDGTWTVHIGIGNADKGGSKNLIIAARSLESGAVVGTRRKLGIKDGHGIKKGMDAKWHIHPRKYASKAYSKNADRISKAMTDFIEQRLQEENK